MIVNYLKENLLLIGFALVATTITTLSITGQNVYANKEQIFHNQLHVPDDIIKASKHLLHNYLDSSNALGGSPGVLSGNVVQVPVHIPANVCGNSVNLIGLLNPAIGNTCANG
jgi:hypothetical protein